MPDGMLKNVAHFCYNYVVHKNNAKMIYVSYSWQYICTKDIHSLAKLMVHAQNVIYNNGIWAKPPRVHLSHMTKYFE